MRQVVALDQRLSELKQFSDEYEDTYWEMYGIFEETTGYIDEYYPDVMPTVSKKLGEKYNMCDLYNTVIAELSECK
jgi:hypothetical protein